MLRTRTAIKYLREWRTRVTRLPLLIRGARQVGKSSLVRLFGREFDHFVELNLERAPDRALFDRRTTARQLLEGLAFRRGLDLGGGGVLLFVDEIQEAPEAIALLRFLHEDYPEVRVIAAGSLLEFALRDVPSFPVGRVEFYQLHPLSFGEYLEWMGPERYREALWSVPAPEYAHEELLRQFHRYALIGGMPRIVGALADGAATAEVRPLYASIWETYRADAERYARSRAEAQVLRHLMYHAPLADDRVKFARFGESDYGSREVGEAFRALHLANVLRLIYPTTALALPLTPNHRRSPRIQLLDTGLLCHARGVGPERYDIDDLGTLFRGRIAQHAVTQEIIAQRHEPGFVPLFWVREQSGSSAEVDLLLQHRLSVVPVEVKSGPSGRLRSLHSFVDRSGVPLAVRTLRNRASVEDLETPAGTPYRLLNVPYYAVGDLGNYIAAFR